MTEGRRAQVAVVAGLLTGIVLAQFVAPAIAWTAALLGGVLLWLLTAPRSADRR